VATLRICAYVNRGKNRSGEAQALFGHVVGKYFAAQRLSPNRRLIIASVVHLYERTKILWVDKRETL
jgi:hypothetical protein